MIIHLHQTIIFTIIVLVIIALIIQMIVHHLQIQVAVIAVAVEIKKSPFMQRAFNDLRQIEPDKLTIFSCLNGRFTFKHESIACFDFLITNTDYA